MRAHLFTLCLVLSAGLACDPGEDADPRLAGCLEYGDLDCDDKDDKDDGEVCGYRTESQSSWGAGCKGKQAGCFRDEHFSAVFAEGLYVGCGQYTANLLSSEAVEAALPTFGTPRALLASEAVAYDGVDDPEVKTSLFGEVVALTLNLEFDAVPEFHKSTLAVPLADLVLAEPSACAGLTVAQVLDEANLALAGCPAAFTPAELDDCVEEINASFTGTKGKKTVCSDLYEVP
jgi:hypothetical protein